MKKTLAVLLMAAMLMSVFPLAFAEEAIMRTPKVSTIDIFNADITPVVLEYPDDHLDFEIDEDALYRDNDHFWYDVTHDTEDIDYFDNKSQYALFWEIECDSDY